MPSRPGPAGGTVPPDGRPWSEQPAWRGAFPIDWAQDHFLARRDFTRFLVLASLPFALGQVWLALRSWFRRDRPVALPIAGLEQVPVGGVLPFRYPDENEPCLLVRPDEHTWLAFSQKCTHLGCAVVPDLEQHCFRCPCHEGAFDLATGRPVAGPPRRPLPRVTLENRDGTLYATGMEVTTL